jgi:hypothetical protein
MSTLVLAAWGGLFWFLLVSDRSVLYLSPRTDWVVPVGAAVLTIATVARLLTAGAGDAGALHPRDTWVFGLLLAPAVVVLALPRRPSVPMPRPGRSSFQALLFAIAPGRRT